MRDAIVLSDLAFDAANHLREMFNAVGALQGEASFETLTEEQIIAACIYFMDMTLRNPLTLINPILLASMRASLNLATGGSDDLSDAMRKALGKDDAQAE